MFVSIRVGVMSRLRVAAIRRLLAVLVMAAALAAIAPPVALSAVRHLFTASYTGQGSGVVTGTHASGSGSMTGHGKLIGRGTMTGSGSGLFTSKTCVVFSGSAALKGAHGTLMLAAHGAHACLTSASGGSFSGSAQVTSGTATFAHARGTISFHGSFSTKTGVVTISFRGRIRY